LPIFDRYNRRSDYLDQSRPAGSPDPPPVWEIFFSPDSSLLAVTNGVEIHVLQVEDDAYFLLEKAIALE
jgi:hypothetical protein